MSFRSKEKNDQIDISHSKLVKADDWGSCLGCHDFHGNHIRNVPKLYREAIAVGQIEAYFAGGLSVYGPDKKHVGLTK